MASEPTTKRTIVFLDGQNLFYSAKTAFGHRYPNFDPRALAERVCRNQNWQLVQTRFYTGYPSADDDTFWNHFWRAKMLQLARDRVHVFSRPLRYRLQTIHLPDGLCEHSCRDRRICRFENRRVRLWPLWREGGAGFEISRRENTVRSGSGLEWRRGHVGICARRETDGSHVQTSG